MYPKNFFARKASELKQKHQHLAAFTLPPQKKNKTFGFILLFFILPAAVPDIFKPLFFNLAWCAVAAQAQRLQRLYGVTYQALLRVVKILGSMIQCVYHSQSCSCSALTSWARLSISTFHSSNVTAAMRQGIAASVPSPNTTTCSLSEKSICILAATSRLARVIPQTTSLQRTSGCTLHKLNLGLHLHRERQSGFNP